MHIKIEKQTQNVHSSILTLSNSEIILTLPLLNVVLTQYLTSLFCRYSKQI